MKDSLNNAVAKVSSGLFVIPLVFFTCFLAILFFIVQGWFLKVVLILGVLSTLLIMFLISGNN